MTDQQIAQGAGPTPVAITVQGSEQLLPKLAFASYDGTGAAGNFLPVVKFVGPGGEIAGQAVGDEVTAGASVDQTWFRGLAKTNGKTAAGPVEYFHDTVGASFAGGAWNLLPWTHSGGSSLLDLSVPTAPTFKAGGVYTVTACIRNLTNTFWTGFLGCWLQFASETEDHGSITLAEAFTQLGGGFTVQQVTVTEARTVTAGELVQVYGRHNNTVNQRPALVHGVVQQIA